MLLVASGGRVGEMQGGGGAIPEGIDDAGVPAKSRGDPGSPRNRAAIPWGGLVRWDEENKADRVAGSRAAQRCIVQSPPRRPGGRTRCYAFAMRVDRSDGTWQPVRAGRNAHDDARPTSLMPGPGRKRLAALDRALHGATGDSARGGQAPATPRGRIRIARLPLRYRRCRTGCQPAGRWPPGAHPDLPERNERARNASGRAHTAPPARSSRITRRSAPSRSSPNDR